MPQKTTFDLKARAKEVRDELEAMKATLPDAPEKRRATIQRAISVIEMQMTTLDAAIAALAAKETDHDE